MPRIIKTQCKYDIIIMFCDIIPFYCDECKAAKWTIIRNKNNNYNIVLELRMASGTKKYLSRSQKWEQEKTTDRPVN